MRLAAVLRPSRILSMQSDHSFSYSTQAAVKRALPNSHPSTSSKLPRTDSRSPMSHSSKFGLKNSSSTSAASLKKYRHRTARLKKSTLPSLPEPLHDDEFINTNFPHPGFDVKDPKYVISNARINSRSTTTFGSMNGSQSVVVMDSLYRVEVIVQVDPEIIGVGDSPDKKTAELLAYKSAVYQLYDKGFLFKDEVTVRLSDDSVLTYDEAKNFMEFYCRRFSFAPPELASQPVPGGWETQLSVGGRKIGVGTGTNKKASIVQCYLDVVKYLERCDSELWKTYREKSKKGELHGYAPSLYFSLGTRLNDDVRDLCIDLQHSNLYRNRPSVGSSVSTQSSVTLAGYSRQIRPLSHDVETAKSRELLQRRKHYLSNPTLAGMRQARMSLPVFTRSDELLSIIRSNEVTICMAATGSGKTTQIPQIILDSEIDEGRGAKCNILCTQPRRLAALSVADRVSKERGESLGMSVGYQVRFENCLPQDHGSITFCTTGVFLKKLQSALSEPGHGSLDHITHVVVDEVHERDVDTDLLLFVLRRLLAIRKAQNNPLKVVLMSATIDPTLFQGYFKDEIGNPARIIDIPGRSYPVQKHFLEDFSSSMRSGPMGWVFHDEGVAKFMKRESDCAISNQNAVQDDTASLLSEEADIPYPLVVATIAHVLKSSDSGHVLVFLPGWEDIVAVQKMFDKGPWTINFNDRSKFSIHLLHSTIPLAEQQVIFDPPAKGVRRIILSTNIAETSVTIPDVVYVVDTARMKEQRYEPERRIMSLVSAWVGSSNLNQRAGRAGRHRSGEYYGILSRERASKLQPYQTVEMARVDLTNVVMHIKALNFPGMAVEEVLADMIEPPTNERVAAAMSELQMVGAIDGNQRLTSLGRVLLQLPVDVQVGRLVLYGSFFRCLEQAVTLAAILTNRDPFVSPMHLRQEARDKKNSWSPELFRSDALATLNAYNAWEKIQVAREFHSANQFCIENFLAKPTLLMIQRIKRHLLLSLYHAGVLQVSAGGGLVNHVNARQLIIPPEMNSNANCLPLLAALIASASQPKYAVRMSEKGFRTQQEKTCLIHPSGVNYRKFEVSLTNEDNRIVKQIYAYAEKRRNISVATHGTPQTFLVTTTRLDPLIYILFGAYRIEKTNTGLKGDGWIPISGQVDGLEDVSQLRRLVDACMLRVYEGIIVSRTRQSQAGLIIPREEQSEGWDDEEHTDYSLSQEEVKELDLLSRDLVSILQTYSDERASALSRPTSRPITPTNNPFTSRIRPTSSNVTPYASRASSPTPFGRRKY